jgi:hypothetical protein
MYALRESRNKAGNNQNSDLNGILSAREYNALFIAGSSIFTGSL